VDNERNFKQDSVYSLKMKAGKRRTYFFDIRKTKGEDFYLTMTESSKKMNGDGYERHKIFLYKEDFNRFLSHLQEAIDHVKTELLPDYDYDEFNHADDYEGEYQGSNRSEEQAPRPPKFETNTADAPRHDEEKPISPEIPIDEEDMSW
jgi:hypothetical protein